MEIIFNRKVKKELASFSQTLRLKESHNSEDIINSINIIELKIEELFKTIIADMDKKLSGLKHEIKNKTKSFNNLKQKSDTQRMIWKRQKQDLERQTLKNKKKIHDLLRHLQQSSFQSKMSQQSQGIQCSLQEQGYETSLNSFQSECLLLNSHISQLELTLDIKRQQLDTTNMMIEELLIQFQENIENKIAETNNQLADQEETESSCDDGSTDAGSLSSIQDDPRTEWVEFEEDQITEDEHSPKWVERFWACSRKFLGIN